ncbi:MAG: hypothetical protein R2881_05075 [Eubacteriales bacterium]
MVLILRPSLVNNPITEYTIYPINTARISASPAITTLTPELLISTSPLKGVITAGSNFTAALNSASTVVLVGDLSFEDVADWKNISQIVAFEDHILGLLNNGTVIFSGAASKGENRVTGWTSVVQIAACYHGSIGLTKNGNILYAGQDQNNIEECKNWTGVKQILGGEDHIVGLLESGNIITSGYDGNGDGRLGPFDFNNVVEGAAANGSTFCVFSDGTVGAYGTDKVGEDKISEWSNIIAISGGEEHTVGLKANGTVVAKGNNEFGQCEVMDWTNIIAIACGPYHTVGLKSDGTLVATGNNDYGQCDVKGIDLW